MEFTNNVGDNINDEFILKITQLTQDVSDIKNMFQELIQISKNNASSSPSTSTCSCHCNVDVKTKIAKQNNLANSVNFGAFKKTKDIETSVAEFLIKSSTDVSISFTDYLTNMDINQDHLLHIFDIDSYEDGFIELLQMYITPENLHYCPLRSFEDKRGKLFYVFDKDPDDNEKNVWTVISSTNLASKLRIVQQKIMAQFCVWQNDNIDSLKSHSFQEKYRIQISKLTCGVVDKVIQSNSTFRNKVFALVKL